MEWLNVLTQPSDLYEVLIRRKLISGASAVLKTLKGISPLTIAKIARKGIKSLTQFGKCEQNGTPTPSAPINIKCNNGALKWDSINQRIYADGTPEVLTVDHIGQTDTYTAVDGRGTYVTPTTTVSTRIYKQLPLNAGRYTITVPVAYDFIIQYRKPADNTITPQDYGNYGSWTNGSETVTFDKADTYGYGISLRLHNSPTSNIDTTDFAGEIKIEHLTVQTATAENLLGVGDFEDTQDIVNGAMTRATGIKVLDGTEEWTTDTYGGYRRMVLQEVLTASGDTLSVICSHYASRSSDARQQPNSIFIAGSGKLVIYVGSSQNITTADEFNAWLAGQYANGTPVIVVYPLAEATTEQVTAQHLTAKGTATITANSGHISNIELEVEYWETAEE